MSSVSPTHWLGHLFFHCWLITPFKKSVTTIDIDVSVEVITLAQLYAFEEQLRARGFRHDTREGAPICRRLVEGVTVDVMPTETAVFGMPSDWFPEGVQTAKIMDLARGIKAPAC